MCILVIKRAGTKKISDETLRTMYENNNDSCGFAYINTDYTGVRRLKVHKYMDFEPFLKKYRRCEEIAPDSHFLLHFRIATSGELTTFNQHPFWVDKETVMGHNGIISSARKDPDGKRNDTQMFIDDTLKNLPEDWMEYESIIGLIEDYIGSSKLAFLKEDGTYLILNQYKGHWKEGIWYSNTSYIKRQRYTKTSYPPSTVNSINFTSDVTCDCCGDTLTVFRINPYNIWGFVEGYCDDCERTMLAGGQILEAEKASKADYIKFTNSELAREFKTYDGMP